MDESSLTLKIDGYTLSENHVYNITLCIDPDGPRHTCCSASFDIIPIPEQPLPLVSLSVASAIHNPGDTLRILSNVTSTSDTPASELELFWTETMLSLPISASDPYVDSAATNLVLLPGLVQEGAKYEFMLEVYDPYTPEGADGGYSYASVVVEVNQPPV